MDKHEDWLEVEERSKRMEDESYWKRRKIQIFGQACEILEDYFAISPTLSDRMFINQYADEFLSQWRKIAVKDRIAASVDIPAEIAGKFLMIHYNFIEVCVMREILYRKGPSIALNKKLRDYRDSFNNSN